MKCPVCDVVWDEKSFRARDVVWCEGCCAGALADGTGALTPQEVSARLVAGGVTVRTVAHEPGSEVAPAGYRTVERSGSGASLEITVSATRPAHVVLILGAAMFDLLFVQVLRGDGRPPDASVVAMTALMAVALTYAALACALNRTRITLDGSRLRVERGPLPFPRQLTVDWDSIDADFHGAEVDLRARPIKALHCYRLEASSNGAFTIVHFGVAASFADGAVVLARLLYSAEQALVVASHVAAFLRREAPNAFAELDAQRAKSADAPVTT